MEIIIFLALILLLGTLSSIIALKLNVSNVFFLVFIGMVIGILEIGEFSKEAIITISTISLIFVIFNSVSKFKFSEIIKHSGNVLRLSLVYFGLCLIVLSLAVLYLFGLENFLLAILFAGLMTGIDPSVALTVLQGKKSEVSEILELESIVNTPLTVIIPLTVLNMLSNPDGVSYLQATEQLVPFLQQFMVAIGVGVVSGMIIVSILKKTDLGNVSYIVLISVAIISYVLAEAMQGNGVLSVTIFGLIFGNYHIRKKLELEHFTEIFSDALQIIVFILIGTVIFVTPDSTFLLKGSLLFLIYIIIRFVSVLIGGGKFSIKEKIFMSLNVPKGVDVAVIILIIISGSYSEIKGIEIVLRLCLLFVLYSIVLSTVATRFTDYFLNLNVSTKKNVKKRKRN